MRHLEKLVVSIIEPSVLRAQFSTQADFIVFLNIDAIGTHLQDLRCILKVFSQAGMFEDCILIKKVLDEKILEELLKNNNIELCK